jgi:hypothetical protein
LPNTAFIARVISIILAEASWAEAKNLTVAKSLPPINSFGIG